MLVPPNIVLLIGLTSFALAACQTAKPTRYSGLGSASAMTPNTTKTASKIPYSYRQNVAWSQYHKAILDSVAIYRGSDSQFDGVSETDKKVLAAYMQQEFTRALGQRFSMTRSPGRGTIRVKLTLTGASLTKPVIGMLSRFDMAGAVYNGVQSARGGEGTFTGAVMYGVEVFDASSNRLLLAFVAKQYPGAYNVRATMGKLSAAKAGIDKGATELAGSFR
ncbi:DUF3313 domain-containing protein [Methyloligella sp. 2.7D]|uniref:DUF3313 domain-containing protein n=1 Tax=unclassified Methyloligella TaxID=2625955 RepID=UPI00157D30C1|nr:DUF3313 domain-containing protein [Methyloligella sp. GL2]QKP75983.1 DUF3313 domain-containing protein [Methyloligella sp. GL2]